MTEPLYSQNPALTKKLTLLIDELEHCASLIEGDSAEFSKMFIDYAHRLRNVESWDATLNELYQYVTHYKGLADEQPASISISKWMMIVERLKTSAIIAFNAK